MNRRIVAVFAAVAAIGVPLGIWSTAKREPAAAKTDRVTVPATDRNRAEHKLIAADHATEPTFVGREVCRECHAENYKLHGQHGHAHTFAVVDGEIADKFAGRAFDAGELFGTYTYGSNEQGLFARLRDKVGDEPFPLQYATGSGHHAITLLTLIADAEKGTVGLEHRVSWFRQHDQLGLTPGQLDGVPDTLGEMFGNRHEDRDAQVCVLSRHHRRHCGPENRQPYSQRELRKMPRSGQRACATSEIDTHASCFLGWSRRLGYGVRDTALRRLPSVAQSQFREKSCASIRRRWHGSSRSVCCAANVMLPPPAI